MHHHVFLCLCVHVQVAAKEQVEGVGSREQAIVEVMVDLLLDLEKITVNQGLVYVLDELESYPVSGLERQQYAVCSISVTTCLSLL